MTGGEQVMWMFQPQLFNIKKDDIIKINVIFADTNQSHVYCIILYYHKEPNKIIKTEFSGNLFNLTNVLIALKKYNFPLQYWFDVFIAVIFKYTRIIVETFILSC